MDRMNRGNKSVLFLLLVILMISSMFLTPSAINMKGEDNNTIISNDTNAELTPLKGREEFSKKNSIDDSFMFYQDKNSYQRYIEEAETKHAPISQNLERLLNSKPKVGWYSEQVDLIVTFDSQFSLTRFGITSYNIERMSVLPIAIVDTSLAQVNNIRKMKGVTGVYLDNYYLFIEEDWKENLLSDEGKLQTYPSEQIIGARDLLELGIDGVGMKIAILDTGIDKTHQDLDDLDNDPLTNDPKVILEASFIDFDDDGINDTDARDEHYHGTHCAGIAAGNGLLKGVAPGAWLMNGRILDSGGGAEISWVIKGIDWAAANGADVISMSIGWNTGDVLPLMNAAVDAAWESGSMVVVAAANDGPLPVTITSPGMASRSLTVGATNIYNDVTYWSSRGPTTTGIVDPDVIAPGDSILSTTPSNGYGVASGTSMATPAVAGVVALLKSVNPTVDIDYIRSAVISSATDRGRHVFEQGTGLVNAVAALEYLNDPSVYVYPSFTENSPLFMSPGEKFEYQMDIFLNQSFGSLIIEPSLELIPYVTYQIIDTGLIGWIRAKISVIMSITKIIGTISIKDGTTTFYVAELVLEPETAQNDAGTGADAGETLSGAIPILLDTPITGSILEYDNDFYSFPVIKDQGYSVLLTDLTNDLDLMITNENGTIIGVSANWETEDDEFSFVALSTGNYYAKVLVWEYGDYTLLATTSSIIVSGLPASLTGNFDSMGVDEDSDGLYNQLQFIVEVDVTRTGYYDFLYTISQKRYNK
jgi:subtilisin family serine protease